MNAATTRAIRCARCGSRLREGRWVYSRFTRAHYCVDLDACAARAKRRGARR